MVVIKKSSPLVRYALTGSIFIFLEIGLMLFVDRPFAQFMHGLDLQHTGLIDIFRAYTDFGKSYWFLWPSGIGLILAFIMSRWTGWPERKRMAARNAFHVLTFFFASIAVSGIATDIVKPIAGRARPVLFIKDGYYGFDPFTFHAVHNSFPSGHCTTALAVACALSVLFPRGRIIFALYAFAICLSRVMVNAHYLSDMLGGAGMGILMVALMVKLFRRRGWMT